MRRLLAWVSVLVPFCLAYPTLPTRAADDFGRLFECKLVEVALKDVQFDRELSQSFLKFLRNKTPDQRRGYLKLLARFLGTDVPSRDQLLRENPNLYLDLSLTDEEVQRLITRSDPFTFDARVLTYLGWPKPKILTWVIKHKNVLDYWVDVFLASDPSPQQAYLVLATLSPEAVAKQGSGSLRTLLPDAELRLDLALAHADANPFEFAKYAVVYDLDPQALKQVGALVERRDPAAFEVLRSRLAVGDSDFDSRLAKWLAKAKATGGNAWPPPEWDEIGGLQGLSDKDFLTFLKAFASVNAQSFASSRMDRSGSPYSLVTRLRLVRDPAVLADALAVCSGTPGFFELSFFRLPKEYRRQVVAAALDAGAFADLHPDEYRDLYSDDEKVEIVRRHFPTAFDKITSLRIVDPQKRLEAITIFAQSMPNAASSISAFGGLSYQDLRRLLLQNARLGYPSELLAILITSTCRIRTRLA